MAANLSLHEEYRRKDVADEFGEEYSNGGKWVTGVVPVGDNEIALFVTLDKTDYSGQHRYEDAFESESVLRWKSQTRASPDNAWGQKHLDAGPEGKPHHLFVRCESGDPFTYCGQGTCLDHEGSNPMTIWWELEEPLPTRLYEEFVEATDHAGGLEAPDYVKSRQMDLEPPAENLRGVPTTGSGEAPERRGMSPYDLEDPAWGWASSVSTFLSTDAVEILEALRDHHDRRFEGLPRGRAQEQAWKRTIKRFQATLEPLLDEPGGGESMITLEYELPGEGGRRPDVIIVTPTDDVFVIECKDKLRAQAADVDQALRYAQDLRNYHSKTHGSEIYPVLALLRDRATSPDGREDHPVRIYTPSNNEFPSLQNAIRDALRNGSTSREPQEWLWGEYEPLPHLIQAVISTFEGEELPRIKSRRSSNVDDAISTIQAEAKRAKEEQSHVLLLVTGAPGSGKTLVGIKSTIELQKDSVQSLFLSGNAPLVAVLQDAIDRAGAEGAAEGVVRSMYKWKQGVTRDLDSTLANVHVFDEGQRAWENTENFDGSEIELLLEVSERQDWGVVVGLIGEGQEIYKGEDGGIGTWIKEISKVDSGDGDWTVVMPDRGQELTSEVDETKTISELHLDSNLRAKNADRLHEWVEAVLSGRESHAAGVSFELEKGGFPIRVTPSREDAEGYVEELYADSPDPRYGWVISSAHNKGNDPEGMEAPFVQTHRVKQVWGPWFNAPPQDPASCCQLEKPCPEFGCQGLELDFILLFWGNDLKRRDGEWEIPDNARNWSESPREHTRNAYRVLMTRGREGMVIRCRDEETRKYLLRCGATPIAE